MNLSPMSWRMFCGSLSWSARTLSLEKMASVSADTCVTVFLAVSYRALAASATLSCIKNQHITQRVSTVLQIHACILKHLIIVHRLLVLNYTCKCCFLFWHQYLLINEKKEKNHESYLLHVQVVKESTCIANMYILPNTVVWSKMS